MFKKLFILFLLVTSLFSEDEPKLRELTDENFDRATSRGLVVIEFYATWNVANKVVILDTWDTFDAKVYRLNRYWAAILRLLSGGRREMKLLICAVPLLLRRRKHDAQTARPRRGHWKPDLPDRAKYRAQFRCWHYAPRTDG